MYFILQYPNLPDLTTLAIWVPNHHHIQQLVWRCYIMEFIPWDSKHNSTLQHLQTSTSSLSISETQTDSITESRYHPSSLWNPIKPWGDQSQNSTRTKQSNLITELSLSLAPFINWVGKSMTHRYRKVESCNMVNFSVHVFLPNLAEVMFLHFLSKVLLHPLFFGLSLQQQRRKREQHWREVTATEVAYNILVMRQGSKYTRR